MWGKVLTLCRFVQRRLGQSPVSPEGATDEVSVEIITAKAEATQPEDEFDPVREIRRLRQDLAHRLRELQERKLESDLILDEGEKIEVTPFNSTPEKNAESLSHHMRQAKKLLSRLQVNTIVRSQSSELPFSPVDGEIGTDGAPIDKKAETPESGDDTVSSAIDRSSRALRSNEKANGLTILDRLEEVERKNRGDFDFLKMANVGLTVSGLLLLPIGAAFYGDQGDSSVGRGAILLFVGALIVGIGLFGHWCTALLGKNATEDQA